MDTNEEMLNVPLSKEAKAGLAQIAKEQKPRTNMRRMAQEVIEKFVQRKRK